jgi:hypothetical protein
VCNVWLTRKILHRGLGATHRALKCRIGVKQFIVFSIDVREALIESVLPLPPEAGIPPQMSVNSIARYFGSLTGKSHFWV